MHINLIVNQILLFTLIINNKMIPIEHCTRYLNYCVLVLKRDMSLAFNLQKPNQIKYMTFFRDVADSMRMQLRSFVGTRLQMLVLMRISRLVKELTSIYWCTFFKI